jgi:hypothetical protein
MWRISRLTGTGGIDCNVEGSTIVECSDVTYSILFVEWHPCYCMMEIET